MVRYELQRLPGAPKQYGTTAPGTELIALLDSLRLHNNVKVRLNGRELNDDFDLSFKLRAGDVVAVFDQPESGGLIKTLLNPVEHLNPIRFTKKVMSGLTGQQTASSPSISTGESPNNDATGQTNRARLYKGRPNIYGQCRVYPDLIQQALFEYIDNNKYITEWFEVGFGKYTISSVRYSESNLGSLAGASYQIFDPGATIGTIDVGYQFDDVDNEEVPGLNESEDFPAQTATTTAPTAMLIESNQLKATVLSNDDNFSYFAALAVPHPVTFVINATWNAGGGPVTRDVTGSGNIVYSESYIGEDTQSYTTFYLGDMTGEITTLPSDTTLNLTLFTLNDQTPLVIGPSVSPLESTQIWVHVMVQLGATSGTSRYRIRFWKVDDNNNQIPGTAEQYDYFFDNDFQVTTRYFRTTHKFSPAAGTGRYAVTIERLDNSNDGNVVTLMAIHAVNTRANVVYPDDTIARVTIKGSNNSNSNREQKYNMLAHRHTISYDRTTGQIDYTLRPSRSFADAALHEWVVIGKQDVSSIDVATLYAIADSISVPELGYFDYTFSDEKLSLGERIRTICNAARVDGNNIGDVLTFWRDEKVTYPDAVFARSNMFFDEYKVSWQMSLPGGYDGVTVDYVDPLTNKKSYVYLQIDASGIREVEDATVNASQISLDGCRNRTQAVDRAWLEAQRLLYSRMSMTVKVLETEQVVRGAVVQCPDMYDNRQQNGYLTGRNGDIFTTSERIDFSFGDMWVVMTDSLGNFRGRWRAYPVSGTAKAFQAAADAFDLNIYNGADCQVASRYFIATESELNSTIWRVETAKPNGDYTQTLTLSEYSDSIYP
ncbi:TPA: host specificity factor TipJ family phage tail protein [Klebsiella aerogenes]|uniref:host specificity factor TipJ family phage tail protein n=3 Tax=Klebsiella aerogenes TaxID=548 RepID=UPI000450E741|nr:host specificity factor TipJ family phage tail protein [Klebsiella aerogenes]EIV6705558.1 MoaD/ThiS family protein [Klebsiella aerogenes]EKU8837622.1 MoaD/ThiS family protein [Klebsiella aerogenes]EKV6366975.1 MoaD/ThiS family protein [Klebsiella aerogenes]EKW2819258.1 MoaD/ThiS family protein [Klebsiella aerogenes]EKW3882443.1 MoaD/ThiS family protein [Klebsiella aerogenes]